MSTSLFTVDQVKKFFDVLSRQSRHCLNLYKGHDKLNPHISLCGREVFVKRTIAKWLKGKSVIWYAISEDSNLQYKKYISINSIRYGLGYGDDLVVNYYDYSRPVDFFNNITVNHNFALHLEGMFCENSDKHTEFLKLTYLDLPKNEYVFKRYDFKSYPKKKSSKEEALAAITTTVSFEAKTLHEAYKIMKDSEHFSEIGELIEVKPIVD